MQGEEDLDALRILDRDLAKPRRSFLHKMNAASSQDYRTCKVLIDIGCEQCASDLWQHHQRCGLDSCGLDNVGTQAEDSGGYHVDLIGDLGRGGKEEEKEAVGVHAQPCECALDAAIAVLNVMSP